MDGIAERQAGQAGFHEYQDAKRKRAIGAQASQEWAELVPIHPQDEGQSVRIRLGVGIDIRGRVSADSTCSLLNIKRLVLALDTTRRG